MTTKLLTFLQREKEQAYGQFCAKLLPTVDPERILGVRMPRLQAYCKKNKDALLSQGFLQALPHSYHEEDLIHAFLLNGERDFPSLAKRLGAFLPHVNNWAVCDSLRPKLFARHLPEALAFLRECLSSPHAFSCRFAMEMLMLHYLDEAYEPCFFSWVAEQEREDYYVKMMQAWYFSTALAKRYWEAFAFLKEHPLPPWVQNKAIQKARESHRLSKEQKEQLLALKTFA